MKDLLQYIFSSFWIFIGCVILIAVIGEASAQILKAIFQRKD